MPMYDIMVSYGCYIDQSYQLTYVGVCISLLFFRICTFLLVTSAILIMSYHGSRAGYCRYTILNQAMLHVTDIEQSIQEIENIILVGLKMPFKDWDNEMSMRLILKVFIYFLACQNMFFSKHKELSSQNKAVFMKHGIEYFFD